MTNGLFGLRVELVLPGENLPARHAYYRLRFDAFGKLEASDPLIGIECDEYDNVAPCFLVYDGDILVAGARILLCEEGPITLDPILVRQDELHGEISRFTISKSLTNKLRRRQVNFCLCAALAAYAFEVRRYQTLYCDARSFFYQILRQMIGETRLYTLGPLHVVKRPGAEVPLVPICIRSRDVEEIRASYTRLLAMSQSRPERPRMSLAA